MNPFPVKADKISGFDDKNIIKNTRKYFYAIEKRTKRQPYIRSAYFNKQKIFFTYFWQHVFQKAPKQRRLRLPLLPCAVDLITRCRNNPITTINPDKKTELLHRFIGITRENEVFYVQIKENVKTHKLDLMSVFPAKD